MYFYSCLAAAISLFYILEIDRDYKAIRKERAEPASSTLDGVMDMVLSILSVCFLVLTPIVQWLAVLLVVAALALKETIVPAMKAK